MQIQHKENISSTNYIYNITVLHSIILMVDQLTQDFYYEVQKLDLKITYLSGVNQIYWVK